MLTKVLNVNSYCYKTNSRLLHCILNSLRKTCRPLEVSTRPINCVSNKLIFSSKTIYISFIDSPKINSKT